MLERTHLPPFARRRAGFTLIELMVVVIIIGILAAIGVKQYGEAQDRSRNTGMVSLVRGVQLGLEGWKADYRGLPDDLISNGATGGDTGPKPWEHYLAATDDSQGAQWPVKYCTGGYLPKTPWSSTYEHKLDTNYNNQAILTGSVGTKWTDVLAGTATLETIQDQMAAGRWADGQENLEYGTLPSDPALGPKSRWEYGYMAYVGDPASSRYLILGVGKVHARAYIVAAKTNN